MNYTNKNEFRFIAIQRSGHHAVINWIISNLEGNMCYLNNCHAGMNPYLSFNPDDSITNSIDIDEEVKGNCSSKDYLIYNYENRSLENIFSDTFTNNIENWVGKSKRIKNILVLRDPFNNIASKYKWAINGKKWVPTIDEIKQLPLIWKSYAKEYLEETNYIKSDKLIINYNQWFIDSSYREFLAKELGLISFDKGIKTIAKWGPNTWGDSFDNLDFDGKANEMKVLERWKFFADDKLYKSFFKDEELISLSEKIFGYIPETEIIYS
jgi:hypothetical protein